MERCISNVGRWFVRQGWWPAVRAVSAPADRSAGWALVGVQDTRAGSWPRWRVVDRSAVLRRPLEARGQDDTMGGLLERGTQRPSFGRSKK